MKSNPLRVHYIQHVPFEGLGSIEHWLEAHFCLVSRTQLFAGDVFPDMNDFDCLFILGGPMSVHDERRFSWIKHEKLFIEKAIRRGKHVLGICLGAQLIASALGAQVGKNPEPEVGWFPIKKAASQKNIPLNDTLPPEFVAFHWHGETFDLPDGAIHLFSSAACQNQGFALGARVLGFQFHLESTPAAVWALVENCRDEIRPGKYIQSEKDMVEAADRFDSANRNMDAILTHWLTEAHADHVFEAL